MELSHALGIINLTAPDEVQSLADLLSPDLIQQAFSLTDTVTLRKRKLPLESMVWLVIGMAIFNNKPMSHIVNLMDIVDRTGRSFTAPSAPDNSITLFDKGFYSLGLLHDWHNAGENRHWLTPLKKNTQ